tara:strand:- start:107 stop:412 length:306 start_codon:yes stop_codon:yes gene_type:complete
MPRLAPELCKEERITFGTYERNLAKDYLQVQREKQYFEFGGKVVTGVSVVAASIPWIVAAYIAKETVPPEAGAKYLKTVGNFLTGGLYGIFENWYINKTPK